MRVRVCVCACVCVCVCEPWQVCMHVHACAGILHTDDMKLASTAPRTDPCSACSTPTKCSRWSYHRADSYTRVRTSRLISWCAYLPVNAACDVHACLNISTHAHFGTKIMRAS